LEVIPTDIPGLAGVNEHPVGVLAHIPHTIPLWHPYRRGWATARKTMSMKDVAALGGWGSEAVLRGVYQQADMAGMIEVIEAQAKLREAR